MSVALRHAFPADVPALTEVYTRRYVHRPTPLFDFRAHVYLLAFSGNRPVGYLEVSRSRREGDLPGKVWAYPTLTDPANTDTLRALFEQLETLPGVRSTFTMTHESQAAWGQVLLDLGYRERLRSCRAVLEVKAIDLSTFDSPEAALERRNIRVHTLTDLREDAKHADKLYALYRQTNRDVPEVGHSDTLDREAFEACLQRDGALPGAYHIAVHEGRYVGYSELFQRSTTELSQETTAVLSSYRRQGVALALKLRGLAHALERGYTHIHTGMSMNNVAMMALNTRLGFRPQSAYLTYRKDLG